MKNTGDVLDRCKSQGGISLDALSNDVVVLGGGPAGVAAARRGVKVLLVESQGYL